MSHCCAVDDIIYFKKLRFENDNFISLEYIQLRHLMVKYAILIDILCLTELINRLIENHI